MTESLENKNQITKLSNNEAGRDKKHVYFFTQSNIVRPVCICDIPGCVILQS